MTPNKPTHTMKLLLIEDDHMIGESLAQALKGTGYTVDWVRDGELAEESLHTASYNLVLLDLGLPRQSGLEVLKSLRKRRSNAPVLIITARDAVSDRVEGLNLGADDYLIKPFAIEEVEARIRALLRRQAGTANPMLEAGTLTLNPQTKELAYGDKTLLLSAREYALMHTLMESPGRVLSRPELEERLYGWNEEVSSNAVEVLIHGLRKKMGQDIIRNIRGLGYMVAKS